MLRLVIVAHVDGGATAGSIILPLHSSLQERMCYTISSAYASSAGDPLDRVRGIADEAELIAANAVLSMGLKAVGCRAGSTQKSTFCE